MRMRTTVTISVIGLAAMAVTAGVAIALSASSEQPPPPPPAPPWVAEDGTIDHDKLPSEIPVMGPDGKPLLDPQGKPVTVDPRRGTPDRTPPTPSRHRPGNTVESDEENHG
ncbi:hypothetical protein GCM10025762_42960 [Haloechinothrix salitolerans]